MFHTSRWDYAYTGGDPSAPLVNLREKRVAIIGTGATGVQCVLSSIGNSRRTVRVPANVIVVDVRGNRPIDPQWFAQVATPGWQDRWMENFAAHLTSADQPAEDLVNDVLDRPGRAIARGRQGTGVRDGCPRADRGSDGSRRFREDERDPRQYRRNGDRFADRRISRRAEPCKRTCLRRLPRCLQLAYGAFQTDTDGNGVDGSSREASS